jgi:hypothetical protein
MVYPTYRTEMDGFGVMLETNGALPSQTYELSRENIQIYMKFKHMFITIAFSHHA